MTHVRYVRGIKAAYINAFQTRAIAEHSLHGVRCAGIKTLYIQIGQAFAL